MFWAILAKMASIFAVSEKIVYLVRVFKDPAKTRHAIKIFMPKNTETTFKVVKQFQHIPDRVVFVYGSLLVKESILKTLPESEVIFECIPCKLNNYALGWRSFSEHNDFIDGNGRRVIKKYKWLSLVVEQSDTKKVDGALIGVTEKGYTALINRERNYEEVNVRSAISASEKDIIIPDTPIYCFIPKLNNKYKMVNIEQLAIRKKYLTTVQSALLGLGHRKIEKPKHAQIIDAYHPHDALVKTCKKGEVEERLAGIGREIEKDIYAGGIAKRICNLTPICITSSEDAEIRNVAETAISLANKTLYFLSENPKFLQFGGWSEVDHALLQHSIAKNDLTPQIARVDIAVSGNRVFILEINADSPGGMLHHDIIASRQAEFVRGVKGLEWIDVMPGMLCDAVVDALLETYSKYFPGQSPGKAILIESDPPRWPTYAEMNYFTTRLGKYNSQLVDVDVNKLSYINKKLCLDNSTECVDLVYKRLLWSDIEEKHGDLLESLRESYVNDTCCIVNSPGAAMSSSKFLMAMMKASEFQEWMHSSGKSLTDGEISLIEQYIPETKIWGEIPEQLHWSQNLTPDYVMKKVHNWVIKSFSGYGGKEVVIGCDCDQASTEFRKRFNNGWILQQLVPLALTPVAKFKDGSKNVEWESRHYILGAYVIGGKCVAIEAKTSLDTRINMTRKALRTSVFTTK